MKTQFRIINKGKGILKITPLNLNKVEQPITELDALYEYVNNQDEEVLNNANAFTSNTVAPINEALEVINTDIDTLNTDVDNLDIRVNKLEYPDGVLKSGDISFSGLDLSIGNSVFAWRINQVDHLNPIAYNVTLDTTTVTPTEEYIRYDILVGTTAGLYAIKKGVEGANTADIPTADTNTLLLAILSIRGEEIVEVEIEPSIDIEALEERVTVLENKVVPVNLKTGLLGQAYVIWSGVGLKYYVTYPEYVINSLTFPGGTTEVTLDATDTIALDEKRYDLIILNSNGIAKVTGASALDPVLPTVNLDTEIVLTNVLLNSGDLVPTGAIRVQVYDENVEWGVSSQGSVGIDPLYSTLKFKGTKALYVNKFGSGTERVIFTAPDLKSFADYDTLTFRIYLPSNVNSDVDFNIYFKNNTTSVSDEISLSNNRYGFLEDSKNNWQLINIPLGNFQLYNLNFNQLIIARSSRDRSFILDDIAFVKKEETTFVVTTPATQRAIKSIITDDGIANATIPDDTFILKGINGLVISANGKEINVDGINKVDKIDGARLINATEIIKLAELEGNHFKGTHLSLSALNTANPTAIAGDFADVDSGLGADVARYIWDTSDSKWVVQSGTIAGETASSIKSKYESNADTNAYTDEAQIAVATINNKQEKLIAGTNITIDNTDPLMPIINANIVDGGSGGNSTLPITRTILNYSKGFDGSRDYQKWVEKINVGVGNEVVSGINIPVFRIPTCEHFINGDLLVAAEARTATSDDSPADIFISRFRQGVLIDKKLIQLVGNGVNKYTNPNLVLDGGRMYLFYSSYDNDGTPNLTNNPKLYYIYSDDNGITWAARTEYLIGDQTAVSTFKYINSPVNSIKHSSGNIIIPFWGKYVGDTVPNYYRSGIIVWDRGTVFTKRINEASLSANEPTIYEDYNGDIIMDCRSGLGSESSSNRLVYKTSDLGATWSLHSSSGLSRPKVYDNIKKEGDFIYRVQIESQTVSSTRKNLNLLRSDLNNKNAVLVQEITTRGDYIWGYGSVSSYLDELYVVSEDSPDLNLYKVQIKLNNGVMYNNDYFLTNISEYITTYYTMNGTSNDSINALNGTNQSGVTFVTGTNNKKALRVDGTDNGYVTFPDNDLFSFTDGITDVPATIAFSVKFNSLATQQLFLNKTGVTGTNREWDFRMFSNAAQKNIRFYLFSEGNSSVTKYIENQSNLVIDVWYHIVGVLDGLGGMKLFVNGVNNSIITDQGYVKMTNGSNVVTLGRQQNSSSFNSFADFYGLIFMKGKTLNTREVKSLYEKQKAAVNLLK